MSDLSRRSFLATGVAAPALLAQRRRPPNIVLLITDDQGYGDLSLHGNPHLQTPNLDRIGREGVQFTNFHVSPVCSPTRSCLMTGRYNYRTGVVDTYNGRSMMYPDEVTLPQALRAAGYRTGIFGKWHLGDNAPMRAMDRGFEEALVHNGGGIGQPSDPPGNGYFDPVLQHNGKPVRRAGYCTDIFTSAALEFIERRRAEPFFCYLATNAPHDPYQVDEALAAPFRALGLDDRTSKVYGMVQNVDQNAGRLLAHLAKLGLDRDTILIYMTDNGPQFPRYNAGMRGAKGTPYEGGLRVPFFLRWPGTLEPGKVARLAAHIDVLPTLLEACGVPLPEANPLDGASFWAETSNRSGSPPPRPLSIQWMRGDRPQPFGGSAVYAWPYKLVEGKELFDLSADPAERNDLAAARPELVRELRAQYERWFLDVSGTRGYAPPRIWIGSELEDPVILTRQDWRGAQANWLAREAVGWWEVDVRRGGRYDVTLTIHPPGPGAEAVFQAGAAPVRVATEAQATQVRFQGITLPPGWARLHAHVEAAGQRSGVRYVEVRRSAGG